MGKTNEKQTLLSSIAHVKNVDNMLWWKNPDIDYLNLFFNIRVIGVEEVFAEDIEYLEWSEAADVLYSFLGIYAIGVWYYNRDKKLLNVTDGGIFVKGKTRQNLYSSKYLLSIQNDDTYDLAELNKVIEPFIKIYCSIGNVIPTWPGGNVFRGQTAGCLDIPELFWHKYPKWFAALRKMYRNNIFLDKCKFDFSITNSKNQKYDNLPQFLKYIEEIGYEKYIAILVDRIEYRTEKIKQFLEDYLN